VHLSLSLSLSLTHTHTLSLSLSLGPEDSLWTNYVKEVDDWLYSKDFNAGLQLFQIVEDKILAEMPLILAKRRESITRRRNLVQIYTRRLALLDSQFNTTAFQSLVKEKEDAIEHDSYHGDASDNHIYLYLASDNDRVKDAFAQYLIGHANISVMRVDTGHHIVHAKDIGYLKSSGNGTAVFNLAMDWYSLSLSNIVFAWRRDTHLTSTFAQVSLSVSLFLCHFVDLSISLSIFLSLF
jgi:hypothetical protein